MMWLKGAWALVRANWLFAVLLLIGVAVLAIDRGAVTRTDRKWVGAQATATVTATNRKAVTDKAAGQASTRVEETTNAELEDLRRRYADLRRRLRAPGAGAAGRADLPGAAGAAAQSDGTAGADVAVLQAANDDLSRRLIDASEEGDRYRAQVIGWQEWWAQVEAAWALGEVVKDKPPSG
jgi:hypothetical protein